jgi:hypothetical protein
MPLRSERKNSREVNLVSPRGEGSAGRRAARRHVLLAVLLAFAMALGIRSPVARADAAAPAASPLAEGPFSVLQAVLRKSLFKVEVARVQIRVDQPTQRKIASIASGRQRTDALVDGVVRAVMDSAEVLVSSELRRDVPLEKYSASIYADLGTARQAGLVSEEAYWSLTQQLPGWFRTLAKRGPRKGDRLLCRVRPGSMHLTYSTSDSKTLIDRTLPSEFGRAVLASYLAPESTFRKDLVGSLFSR